MSEQVRQENQKTIVAFAAGLLIGGLLVWVFAGSPKTEDMSDNTQDSKESTQENTDDIKVTDVTIDSATIKTEEKKSEMLVGEGKAEVGTQKAGTKVVLGSTTFPTDEGWIGVRDYVNGQPTGLLGVARYSKVQGLVPTEVVLQRSTKAGSEYAVVFYKESGDLKFNLANDKQVDGVFATFKAN